MCVFSPEMAICWILNWMLIVGFSSGLEAPACRLMVPFRLGSFCGLILPTSHVNIWQNIKHQDGNEITTTYINNLSLFENCSFHLTKPTSSHDISFLCSDTSSLSFFEGGKHTQTQSLSTFVTGSKVYAPWEGLRLALRTPRGSWLLTRTDSTALPIVCLGPRVKSKRPCELPSRKVMLCLTYTGIATRLKIKQAKRQPEVIRVNIHLHLWDPVAYISALLERICSDRTHTACLIKNTNTT